MVDRVHPGSAQAPVADAVDAPAQFIRAPKGPVRILCDEIGFTFDPRLERPEIVIAFARELIVEVEHKRMVADVVSHVTNKPPSAGSAEVLALAHQMLDAGTIASATAVHDACHALNPDEAYPTDHLIDMVSSIASAVRFGLECPCQSRHAASAAQHVWKQIYGVSLFDSMTPAWENDWARSVLTRAIVSELTRALGAQEASTTDGATGPGTNTENEASA